MQRITDALELLVAHFIAITTWIEGNRRLPELPRELRLPHYLGMGVAISTAMVLGTVLSQHRLVRRGRRED